MAQDDDSFIREVNEELRRENARALWGRYGPVIIGGAVALVLATAAYQAYHYWTAHRAGQVSEVMLKALILADGDDHIAARDALDEVEATGFGAYPSLAALRKAGLLAQMGEMQAAIAAFDAIVNDTKSPEILKNIARIRAAYLLLDQAPLAEVEARVRVLAHDNEPMRLAAWEVLGLAAWKAGQAEMAIGYFDSIIADRDSGATGFQNRARMMLELIKSRPVAATTG